MANQFYDKGLKGMKSLYSRVKSRRFQGRGGGAFTTFPLLLSGTFFFSTYILQKGVLVFWSCEMC